MSKSILIVGGKGMSGKTIRKMLSGRNSLVKLLIGTRNKSFNPNYIQLDGNDLKANEALKNHSINTIIVCTEDTNNRVLIYALKHKIDYIDITKPSCKLFKAHFSIINSKIIFSS